MKRVLPVFLTLVCLFLFANPVFAQTPEPNSDDVETEDDAAVGVLGIHADAIHYNHPDWYIGVCKAAFVPDAGLLRHAW